MGVQVTPVIFVGVSRGSPIEALMADAQIAIAWDTLARLLACPEYDSPIVATSSPEFARSLADQPVRVVLDSGAFHFGRVLSGIVRRYGPRRVLYLGGGAAPLVQSDDFSRLARTLQESENVVVANNFFSADFVGFAPADALERIDPPEIDNDLAYRLVKSAGLRNVPLARTVATQMDLDTPTDLLILALHPDVGPRLRHFLDATNLDDGRLLKVGRVFTDPTAEVIVAGRVGPHLWSALTTDMACRSRVFSEERGMRASGREARGEVRSLLGIHLETVGPDRFFLELAQLGDVAFIDSRVIFAHLGLSPSAADRFNSDLLRYDEIEDPTVRELTHAAARAPIPIVFGGHSLVAGGLWALIDAAWRKHDEERAAIG